MGTFLKAETEKTNRSSDVPCQNGQPSLLPFHTKEGRELQTLTPCSGLRASSDTETTTEATLSVAHASIPFPSPTFPTPNVIDSSSTRPGLSVVVDTLVAVTSEEYERYDRGVTTQKHRWDGFMIEPVRVDYLGPRPENGWRPYTHPEGIQYFHNTSWHIPVITDVYIHEKYLRERLETYIHSIFDYINEYKISLPSNICLVLEFRQSGRCGYYFVDHTAQCLFWLDDFDAMVFLNLLFVTYTPSLIGLRMKSMYWRHNAYFPHLFQVHEGDVQDMRDLLIHTIGDSLTSPTGTIPYSVETLEKMLSIVKEIRADIPNGPGSAATLYRFLQLFYYEKFLNLHGEHGARLDVEQSIHPERGRTLLIKIISPILLFGPDIHLRQLKEVSVDSLVREHRWTTLFKTLTDGWKEFTLYATVLLNANMVFLAIQSVDSSGQPHKHSAMQRSSYFSITTSVGGILLGLLLVWQHQYRMHSVSFIADRSYSVIGLETLAIMYSLPYSLLMWSFLSFLLAFLLMCLNSLDVTTFVTIGISVTTLLLLLCWSASLSLGDRPFRNSGLLSRFARPDVIDAGVGRLV